MLNLITDPWIPVRTAHGPRVIRPDQIAEPDVLFPDWPRADLNLACLELLVGLVFLAAPPADTADWRARRAPDAKALRDAMARLAPAFDLLGDGPRFLQEAIRTNEAPNPPDMLFIDSAGASTAKKNAALMVRPGRYDDLALPLGAMALYTLQAFAPSGGSGNRTSMRGGGPMVTLVRPDGSSPAPLWSLVWANVPDGVPLDDLGALPWMRPTPPTSEKAGDVAVPSRDDNRPEPEIFFGMPRRLWLMAENRGSTNVVTGVHQRPRGANYFGWTHPLTPYYTAPTGKLPRHPKAGTFGYRNWRGIVLQSEDVDRAATIDTFLGRTEWDGDGMRLIVGGWAMNNMSPVDFLWSEQPLFPLSPNQEARACDLVDAGEQTARALGLAVREATREDIATGAAERARETFFAATQTGFERLMARLAEADETVGDDWLRVLRRHALARFDAEVSEGLADLPPTRREAAVVARRVLLATLAGRTKTGAAIFGALGLDTPARRPAREEEA